MGDNDSNTFKTNKNPMAKEKTVSATRPPSGQTTGIYPCGQTKTRKKHRDNNSAGSSENVTSSNNGLQAEVSFVNGATPTDLPLSVHSGPTCVNNELITDIFHINGTGYDVTLSLENEKIHWEPMNPGPTRKRSGSFSTGLFKRRKSSSGLNKNSIEMQTIIGARIKRQRVAGQKENEGFALGIGLFTYEFKDANVMREREIYLEHPSVEICAKWSEKLKAFLDGLSSRPKNVKLFLQPYAGDKTGKGVYKHKVLPLFRTAGVAVDMTVVLNNEHIKQEMCHINMNDFDCVIAMGGDGTVSQLLNALMNRSQKEQGVRCMPGFTPAKAVLPMGVIPIGKTNQVACSMMGTNDILTACLHIILGHFSPIDISSIYTLEGFHMWAFICQYGFAGNVLQFMQRYSALGNRRMDAAFIKALTSSKLRSYKCDIEYIPAPNVISPTFNTECRTGCEVCNSSLEEKVNECEVVTDMVQELDLNNSISSSESAGSVIELKQDSLWRALKGDFMSISIFTIPGNCEVAPQGLSKITHLHDGNMDLVVVKSVERKDFMRFLRRHGNSKNQFDFPFIEVIRCKQLRFRPRMPISWNYQDHNFSEIKYQMTQQQIKEKAALQRHKSVETIDEFAAGKSRAPEVGVTGKAQSMYALDISDEDSDEEAEGKDSTGGGDDVIGFRNQERVIDETPVGREKSEESKFQYVGTQYQPTWTEQEIARREKIARMKEDKKKKREERKGRSIWNIDNEICTILELDFRVHSNLLLVCGCGISPHTEFPDVRFGCLP